MAFSWVSRDAGAPEASSQGLLGRLEDGRERVPEVCEALVDDALDVADVLAELLLLGLGEAGEVRDEGVDVLSRICDAAEIVLEEVHVAKGDEVIAAVLDQEDLGVVDVAHELHEPVIGRLGLAVGVGELFRDVHQSLEGPAQLVLEERHDRLVGAGVLGGELAVLADGATLGDGLEILTDGDVLGGGLGGGRDASLGGDGHSGLSFSSGSSIRRTISKKRLSS